MKQPGGSGPRCHKNHNRSDPDEGEQSAEAPGKEGERAAADLFFAGGGWLAHANDCCCGVAGRGIRPYDGVPIAQNRSSARDAELELRLKVGRATPTDGHGPIVFA